MERQFFLGLQIYEAIAAYFLTICQLIYFSLTIFFLKQRNCCVVAFGLYIAALALLGTICDSS